MDTFEIWDDGNLLVASGADDAHRIVMDILRASPKRINSMEVIVVNDMTGAALRSYTRDELLGSYVDEGLGEHLATLIGGLGILGAPRVSTSQP